jgi:hypothetical protein
MHSLPAVVIRSLRDLESDEEELQEKHSINSMRLHRNMRHGVRRIPFVCLPCKFGMTKRAHLASSTRSYRPVNTKTLLNLFAAGSSNGRTRCLVNMSGQVESSDNEQLNRLPLGKQRPGA